MVAGLTNGQNGTMADNEEGVLDPSRNFVHDQELEPMARPRKTNGINKSEAIRQAFKELGDKAMPKEVVAHLAKKGIQVKPNMVSILKSKEKKKSSSSAPKGANTTAAVRSTGSNGSVADRLVQLRSLAESFGGVHELQKIVNAMMPF
jgi:hypothetical protein